MGLNRVTIPRLVGMIDARCFVECELLAVVSFEADSAIRRISDGAFVGTSVRAVTIEVRRRSQVLLNDPGCKITLRCRAADGGCE
jgi:hypothetical protein